MSYAMELSPAGYNELLVDLDQLGPKVGRALIKARAYLRRFGSLPTSERALATILGLTVRFLGEVAWPLLQDRLVLSGDGERYYDPDISAARPRHATERPKADRRAQASAASQKRWDRERARRDQTEMAMAMGAPEHADTDANPDAKSHANGMLIASENSAISMLGASENDAVRIAVASPDVARARPPTPFLPSLNPNATTQNQEGERGGEGGKDAREADAGSMRTDANQHANQHANRHAIRIRPADPPVLSAPIPPDWEPDAAGVLEARKRGLDPIEFASKFRDHYLHSGGLSNDFQAQFRNWCREGQRSSGGQARPIAAGGGQPKENYVSRRAREIVDRRAG